MNFNEYMAATNDEKFDYFMRTRFPTNRTPSYWVNWGNVTKNLAQYELELNTLNYLIGKPNIIEEAMHLFEQQPNLLTAVPILIASRELDIDVLAFKDDMDMYAYHIDFKNPDVNKLDEYIQFMLESGLLEFLRSGIKRSLVDYVYGVQAGLDSNGRKNRSGTENEIILENNLKILEKRHPNCHYKTQATAKFIKNKWDITVPEVLKPGKSGGRRYDGAVYNEFTKKVTVIETNFYGGGGSKLKAVSGEFSSIYETSLKDANQVGFAWISDGPGWDTAKNPLREAFDVIPTIFNLQMVKDNFLEEYVSR
ncbi:MAG: type II restriction endonuclease [Lactobacillus sp.]|jgi:type II restriction enzyme|nr:type II restriction endonuclease [Lactobacillus sp.]